MKERIIINSRSYMLENEEINKLLFKLSLPAVISMIVTALYNIVDTIFIGRGVGTLGIGGVTIAMPVQMIIMAFALMIGIGASSAISRCLGAKEYERADYIAGNSFFAVITLSLITVVFGLIFLEPILILFGATKTLLPYAKDYLSIIFIGSIFFSFAVSSNNLIRAEGNAKASMKIMLIGTIINIILDPIFIFVFELGIKGAALATIISQVFSFLYIIKYLYGGESSLHVKLYHLKPQINILKEIIAVGSASFMRNIAGSIVSIVVNNSLKIYGGDIYIAIFGIVNRVIMFMLMPLFGVVQGMQPIAGFNYGAKKYNRVKEVVRVSILVTIIISTSGFFIGELFPQFIMKLFSKETELLKEGVSVLRIIIIMSPIVGIQVVGGALYQSLGKALPSLVLSLLRQVILLIPLVILLPQLIDSKILGVWIAFPVSDLLSTLVTYLMIKKEMNNIVADI